MWKKWFKGLLAVVVLLGLAGAVYVWRAFPQLDGQLAVPGLSAPVQVRRDAADVTHIEAATVADASFALGYVHAQERGWQLEFNRRVMHGRLSEVFGPTTLSTDRLMRTLGIRQAAQAQYARLPGEVQAQLQAYANGINAFFISSAQALPPEFHVLRVRPGLWQPQDSVGWALMMALDLGGNWGNEFARLSLLQTLDTTQLWQLMPPYPGEAPATRVDLARLYRELGVYRSSPAEAPRPSSAAPAPWLTAGALTDLSGWAAGLGHVEGKGSNNWVVAGNHSSTGKPLLANDPHLGLSAPAVWYFARLKAPAGNGRPPLDVIGATLPGMPGVVLGRTAGVAWGFTNTGPDVQDLYLEQIRPEQPNEYRTPLGWAAFDTRDELIAVKGQPDETLKVRSTRHGPVLSDVQTLHGEVIDTTRYVLALRWTALDADNRTAQAAYEANFARSVADLVAAYRWHHSPMQNVVMADTNGQTRYQAVGRVPVRAAANDLRGVAPAPGWEARYDWTGWIAPEETPRVAHEAIAAHGWHATANQRIVPPEYPFFLTQDWNGPERFDRIEALLAARPQHDLESLQAIQGDTVSLATLRLLPVLRAARVEHPLAAAALATLREFDGDMRAGQAAPLIVAVWADELTRGLVEPRIGAARFASLYGKRHFRAGLETMLRDPAARAAWCGPQGCDTAIAAALGRALDRIQAWQGADVAQWQWGREHQAASVHRPFGNVAPLARWFDVRMPTGGDSWTVNVGQYWANDAKTPFANRHAASLRALYDLSDLERSRFIYQTGQSGLVFSPRYRDMSPAWAAVQMRPLQLQPSEADWRHTLQLMPN